MSVDDWQVQVGDVTLGADTKYRMSALDHEKPDTTAGDGQRPGQDGITFGRDTLGGTVITIEAGIVGDDAADAFDLLAAWCTEWQQDAVRATPGAVAQLRYQVPGRDEGIVFGRPRRFAPSTLENAISGYIPVTADWQCADHRFYAASEKVITLGTVPDTSGGITWDLTWDVTWAGEVSAGDQINNTGNSNTFPVIKFNGPIANPGVAWGDVSLSLGLTLTGSQSVTVDCRPWVQSATYASGGSVAGLLRGDRMADMLLPPGSTEVLFSGTDLTATASCEIRWRDASSSW